MFVRFFFLYSESYKCGTKAIRCEHLFAIMVSIGPLTLTLFIMMFDFIPSF